MLKIDLVPVELIEVVSDDMVDSSIVVDVLIDSWHVFISGVRESGWMSSPP